jgi:hypothetical protein
LPAKLHVASFAKTRGRGADDSEVVEARGLRSAETRTLGFLALDAHARFLADPLTD